VPASAEGSWHMEGMYHGDRKKSEATWLGVLAGLEGCLGRNQEIDALTARRWRYVFISVLYGERMLAFPRDLAHLILCQVLRCLLVSHAIGKSRGERYLVRRNRLGMEKWHGGMNVARRISRDIVPPLSACEDTSLLCAAVDR